MNRSIQTAMLIFAVASASAWGQGKSDMNLMQRYGGVLAPDSGGDRAAGEGEDSAQSVHRR